MRSAARLARELRDVVQSTRATDSHDHDRIYLFPVDTDDLTRWRAFLPGPPGTPYEGVFFELALTATSTYPVEPPKIKFVTPIFHPNINYKTGEICLDILKAEWSPVWTLLSACRAISAMLSNPEADSPLNCDAGNLIRHNDMRGYNSLARMYAIDRGMKSPTIPDTFKR
ncbi:E2 ubiquitin-conjugating enzyme [Plasmodiophora brassicae]|nr:hypothetical protein PBRA_000843 [Plasmodiophora brassicae]